MWFQNKMENFQALILLIFSNLHILIEWTVGRALAGISEGLLRLSGQEIFFGKLDALVFDCRTHNSNPNTKSQKQ